MGGLCSFENDEQTSWINHLLKFDGNIRRENIDYLKNLKNGDIIWIGSIESQWNNISYEHWFITDDNYFIEFGSANSDIYKACVTINTNKRDYEKKLRTKMNDEIRGRIYHVLGMKNYSLALRNCEHVANYIFRNMWVSDQMKQNEGKLFIHLLNKLPNENLKLLDTFPSNVRPHLFASNEKSNIYTFSTDHFEACKFDYYLDSAEDTFNILVLGPTGAGKSHLINVLFNQPICQTDVSLKGVTKDIYFVRGHGKVYDLDEKVYVSKEIIVADAVGFCDTEWDSNEFVDMISNRVSAKCKHIDTVFIVFKCDRLIKQHVENIKKILEWLGYNKQNSNYKRFKFVGTHAEYFTDEKITILGNEFKEIFDIKENTIKYNIDNKSIEFDSLILTGFPPETEMHYSSKERVEEGLQKLFYCCNIPSNCKKLEIPQRSLFQNYYFECNII